MRIHLLIQHQNSDFTPDKVNNLGKQAFLQTKHLSVKILYLCHF